MSKLTSLPAKCVRLSGSFACKSNLFSYETFSTRTRFQTDHKAPQQRKLANDSVLQVVVFECLYKIREVAKFSNTALACLRDVSALNGVYRLYTKEGGWGGRNVVNYTGLVNN